MSKVRVQHLADPMRHQTSRPPLAERDNSAEFDAALKSLDVPPEDVALKRFVIRATRMLSRARKALGVSQEDAARGGDFTQPYVSRLENEGVERRGPSLDVLMRYARGINCDLEIALRHRPSGAIVTSVSTQDLDRSPEMADPSSIQTPDAPLVAGPVTVDLERS